ncbi:MAG: cytochrome-c peroxidase, partial [Flavobacteriales bacterium]|nr:cytochrome-c peroxidase [Flavobacteriales bacterium]
MRRKTLLTVAVISSLVLIAGTVDLNNLLNYEDQNTPSYVIEDNTPQDNEISDEGATLGRILFYDKKLSKDNTIACASCHLQEYAFGDTALVSTGVNGVTARHSMRLVNARYSDEVRAFWDERAVSFEDQASQPIQDHVEMGYSGTSGDADFEDLIVELEATDIYPVLFEFVFEDSTITEERIQKSIAQFVRSMESFDSKYDIGRAQVNNDQMSFPNFTSEENLGKQLFFTEPPMGGAGCMRCHDGPEFTLITNTDNNGVIGVANDTSSIDLTNTHSPSLRDLVNPNGEMNGPF